MTARQLIAADLLIAVLSTAAWLGTAISAAMGRGRMARGLAVTAVVVTLARAGVVAALAGHGWWFVQDKVTLALPLVGACALAAAAVLAVGGLSRAVVPLFATGYAAAAGLGFSFLDGYPSSLAKVFAALAIVGVATLVTWHFIAPNAARRFVVAGGGAVAASGLAAVALGFVPAPLVDAGGGPVREDAAAQSVALLRGPAEPEPGGTVRRYGLQARQATITLASGRQVAAWTYNGQVPGPAITASEGDLVEVTLTNVDITDGVTLHWHGYDVANAEDGAPGVTQDAVAPGGSYVYRFLADQVGTYWYHTHKVSDTGVRLGLYGTLLVKPRAPAAGLDLTIPVHTLGGTVVIGVDDGIQRHDPTPRTPVRLRLINTDSTPHRFALAGTGFRMVAVDGNDIHEPGELEGTALRLAAGGRYDISFTMPSSSVALAVDDETRLLFGASDPPSPDTSGWPELDLTTYGTPAPTPFGAGSDFDRDFALVLDRGFAFVDGRPAYAHTVNGLAFPNIPPQYVRMGDLVRVTVANRSLETHPWHLHGHRVLILAKDGRAVTGSPLWMDTFDVRPGEVWQVAFRASNPGVWMNHCHNLSHADLGMALHLTYEGYTTPLHADH